MNTSENSTQLIGSLLEKLSEKLGVKAELLFDYYLKEAKLYRYHYLIDVFTSAIGVAIAAGLLYVLNNNLKLEDPVIENAIVYVVGGGATIFASVIFLAHTLSLSNLLTSITNPEHMAIQNLLYDLTDNK